MKNRLVIIVVAVLAITTTVQAQTPTNEEEAKKMMDSIMKKMPPGMRKMMEQAMQDEEKRKAEKKQVKKNQLANNQAAQKQNEDEFYWKDKIATDTQGKFENWPHGQVEIRTSYRGRDKKKNEMKIGSISANGEVLINLPKIDRLTVKPMSAGQHGSERVVGNPYLELEYSNKNTSYLSTRHNLIVYSGEENIGFIHIGNSIKPVVNLNAPCCLHKAGDGYTAYWVYTGQANSIAGVNIAEDRAGNESKIVCDLNFKPGWNLIMERVEGAIEEAPESWKNQYYTASTTLPEDAKYYFHSNQ
ncbi:hypothetical protein [uncultured Croceitalea sp.]|uniref:hypothetical protein n=1 Tax=uncultured Croceitalea sp. TaxID=1798908 RepID=UPI00330664D0